MHFRNLAFVAFISFSHFAIADEKLDVVQNLFTFLTSEYGHDGRLGKRPELIEKWLSPQLVSYTSAVECDAKLAFKEENRPLDYVNAEIFFDRWDTPSTCKASAASLVAGKQTSIVECRWGKGADHAVGESIQLFADIGQFDGQWRVTNVRHGRQEPAGDTKTDLLSRLLTATKQSNDPSQCSKKYGI
jgi:hypothetical protein